MLVAIETEQADQQHKSDDPAANRRDGSPTVGRLVCLPMKPSVAWRFNHKRQANRECLPKSSATSCHRAVISCSPRKGALS
jgi:hypothetical protein